MARDVVAVCRQAMHDRDRFQRERDYWREEAERLQRELDEANENCILEMHDMASRMDC